MLGYLWHKVQLVNIPIVASIKFFQKILKGRKINLGISTSRSFKIVFMLNILV